MSSALAGPLGKRSSGLLLHVSSLPGQFGIGDFGPAAMTWIDELARARQSWWQVLPLTPTGYGNSPYQSLSSFAGNTLLISPERLVEDGFLDPAEVPAINFPAERVDFDAVSRFKDSLLSAAWERFRSGATRSRQSAFAEFCDRESTWLDNFALFMSLKAAHGGKSWIDWEPDFRLRKPEALARARSDLKSELDRQRFGQFLFFQQAQALLDHAHSRGVKLIGDVPIFVAADSADVWANPELFLLDEQGQPTVVAGVPPDYFSATGQLWGNPLYDWPAHKDSGFAWWRARLRAALRLVDVVRLDHFRGFEAYWEIPAGMATAEHGHWAPGPGADLFQTLTTEWSELPLIAEDLGVITPPVDELRKAFHLPGMSVLQFAFGGAQEDRFLPHYHRPDTVVYTGTHDNDTTVGWYSTLTEKEIKFFCDYAPGGDSDPAWTLLRLAWGSVATLALAPVQDVLRLGSAARLNVPGTATGNWCWRLETDQLSSLMLDQVGELTKIYQRCGQMER